VWWRRPRRPDAATELGHEVHEFVRGEWEHFLLGLESCTHVRWVNAPVAERSAGLKAHQLVVAREEGLRVPWTLLTNDPDEVRSIAGDGPRIVYKRIGPAPRPLTATKELQPTDLERLDVLPNCPAIFQERIDARLDIRVTAIGRELFAAEIDSQSGESPLDWRFDHTVPFRPHRLEDDTAARLRRVMDRLGLLYGAIDLRVTPDGEYVFLELNPSGQYLFVELLADMPLTEHMASFLAER
jgi:glutathione synthase/RimK-type ligase-like ATP-grasp enzyme